MDARAGPSSKSKYRGQCDVGLEALFIASCNFYSLEMQYSWQDVVGGHNLSLGYPISRRPEGYSGLELSLDILLYLMQAKEACVIDKHILIKGPERTVKLVKHSHNVCLWHPLDRITKLCFCDQFPTLDDISDLQSNRHIIGSCVRQSSRILQSTEHDRAPIWTNSFTKRRNEDYDLGEASSVNDSGIRTMTLREFRPHAVLSIFHGSRSKDVAQSRSTSRSIEHRVSEEYPFTADTERPQIYESSQSTTETDSGDESFDTDQLSISDSSECVKPMDVNEPLYPIVIRVLHQLLNGYRSLTHNSTTEEGQQSGASPGAPEQPSSSAGGYHNQNHLKRKRGEEEKDDADQHGSQRPQKRISCGPTEASKKSFACPYLKKDSIEYHECCTRRLSRIRDVKQHLARRHTPERYCSMCFTTSFANQRILQDHINDQSCTIQDPSVLKGVSYDQRQQLSKKSNSNLTEEGQWFAIWEIIFAESPKPASAYIDAGLSVEMRLFSEYSNTRGPAMLSEAIMSNPNCSKQGITEEARQGALEQVIAEGLRRLFETWSSAQPTNPRPSRHRRSHIQLTDQGTPMSSIADSGVAMGSQVSSLEAGPQRSGIAQSLSVPEFPCPPREAMARVEVQTSRAAQDSIVETPQVNNENVVNVPIPQYQGSMEHHLSHENDQSLEYGFDFGEIDVNQVPIDSSILQYFNESGKNQWPDMGI